VAKKVDENARQGTMESPNEQCIVDKIAACLPTPVLLFAYLLPSFLVTAWNNQFLSAVSMIGPPKRRCAKLTMYRPIFQAC
jgi:hypothetical protein